MKSKQLAAIVTALAVVNILDGSFADPGILDWVKLPLFALCYAALLARRERG